jgi:thioredoxin 1
MADDVLAVSDDSFEREVLHSSTPVLVDFWAPWCAPCRAIAPIVGELSREYAGKLKVVKMNVDENPKTPSQYGVRGIPTLLLIEGGQVKEQLVGAHTKAKLVSAIGNVVAVA